jgi:hypothetical protein
MLFDCFISWFYMRVLKLTLGKIFFFCKFSFSFSFSVWIVQTNLFLRLEECGLVIRWSSSSRPDGQVTLPDEISTSLRLASLSLLSAHLCIFIMLWVCLAVCFRDFGILCTSLFIPRYLLWLSYSVASFSRSAPIRGSVVNLLIYFADQLLKTCQSANNQFQALQNQATEGFSIYGSRLPELKAEVTQF